MLASARASGVPRYSELTPEKARALLAQSRPVLGVGPAASVDAISIPTRAGSVPARLYYADRSANRLIVYVHGGGWVLGTPDDFDALFATWRYGGKRYCSCDYRLAPEYRFPAGLEDVEDAIVWAAENRSRLW